MGEEGDEVGNEPAASEGPAHRRPATEAEMPGHERAIRVAGTIAFLVTMAAALAGRAVLPLLFEFPTGLADRLAFAAMASLFVLVWVMAGVIMVSTGRRFSPEDIGGATVGPPSERIAVYVAFLQNTLEQAVLACGLYLALAALLSGPGLSLIVVGVVLFGLGRVLFLRGYGRGVRGRALGMTLTMTPTVLGYLLAVVLMLEALL